jgi:RNA polymerase sigma factor (sigma-70 family)
MVVPASFEMFVDGHYDRVRRGVALATGDTAIAEEAAQEAFARAWRSWRRVGDMDRPDAWVYVVAMNWTRRRRTKVFETERQGTDVLQPDHAGGVAVGVAIRHVLGQLSPRQREAVILRFFADLPLTEVANAMGCAEGTAKSTLHAALSAMRVQLHEEDL